MSTIDAALIAEAFTTILGWLIGRAKNRPTLGALFGLAIGALGLIILVFVPTKKQTVPPTTIGFWATDPWDPQGQRWWDGTRWTAHTAAAGGRPQRPINAKNETN